MDDRRFDDLIKTAGTAPSRRRVLGAFVAAAFGAGAAGAVRGASAQEVGTEAFDPTCQQQGTQFFCQADANQVTTCGRTNDGCRCAELQAGGAVCIQQLERCPRRNRCRRNRNCGRGEVCVRLPDCCSTSNDRGTCAPRCPR